MQKRFKLHGLMDKVITKRTELLADKKAIWLENNAINDVAVTRLFEIAPLTLGGF